MPEISNEEAKPTAEREAYRNGSRPGDPPGPPKSLLSRVRLVFLFFSALMAVVAVSLILQADATPLFLRVSAIAGLSWLVAWWIRGYRRGRFPIVFSPLEGSVVFAAALATGAPPTALGLIFSSIMFRSLYGSLRSVVLLLALYMAAFFGAVAVSSSFTYLNLPLATVLPEVVGLPLVAVMFHVLATTIAGRERAMLREKTLRESAAALVAALGREGVYGAALEGAQKLTQDSPGTRVCLAVGPPEKMTVSAAGDDAAGAGGAEVNLHDLPEPIRASLLVGAPADTQHANPETVPALREALGFEPKIGSVYHVPLLVRGEFEGLLVVSSDSVLPQELKDSLNTLGAQTALSLESITLTEELYRRRSEERMHSLLQNTSDLLTVVDAEGTVLYESPSVERVLGYEPEELIGESGFRHVHPDDLGRMQEIFAGVTSSPGPTRSVELRVRRSDGSWRVFESVGNNLLHDPALRGIVINSRDVTERKEGEQALRESESSLAAAQRMAGVGNWTIELDEDEIRWSDEMYRIFGYSPQEFVVTYRKFVRMVHPGDRRLVQSSIREAVYGDGRRHSLDYRLVRPDGEARFLHSQYEAVVEAGRPIRLVGTSQDVTERKRAEEALQGSEERYRAVVEQAGEGIFLFDPQTKDILQANLAFREMFGYTREELAQMKVYDLIPHDPSGVDRNVRRAVEQGNLTVGERDYRRKDGSRIDVQVSGSVISYSGKQVVCSVIHDITERKRAEEALQESHNLLQGVTEGSTDAVFVKDARGRYLMVNSACADLFGLPTEEAVGRYDGELFAPDEARRIKDDDRRLMAAGETQTFEETLTFAGRERTYLTTKGVHRDHRGEVAGVFGVARDITERKRAEELLRQRSTAMDASIDGMAILDENATFTYVNEAHAEVYGYDGPEELVGRTWGVLYGEAQLAWFWRHVMPMLRGGGHWRGEAVGRKRDGSAFPQEVSVTAVGGSGFVCVVRDVTERKRIEEEIRRLNEGLEARVAERTAQLESAVRESRRAAEALRESEARLKQSNRELQDFAYVASHDLQEPLRKVRTFGDRLRTKYADALGDQGRDYLERMEGSAERMQGLIEDLLALSRVTTKGRPFAPVDLGEVAREVLSDLEARTEGAGGRVEVGEMPTIEADRAQVRQLFQNLIGNALKFRREGEPPVVKVRAALSAERGAGGSPDGGRCRITVEDNGIGLEERYLERIFAPFERLHGRASYEGTGMGLAICRRVVERHGGDIKARSAPGRGTTFVVTLPAKQPEAGGEGDGAQGEQDDPAR